MNTKFALDMIIPYLIQIPELDLATDKIIELVEKIDRYRWHDLRMNPKDLPSLVENCNDVKREDLKECQLANGMVITGFYTVNYLGTKHWSTYANRKNRRRVSTKVVRWREIEPF